MRYFRFLLLVCRRLRLGFRSERTQIFFKEPNGMKVHWLTKEKGKTVYSKTSAQHAGTASTSSRARIYHSN